MRQEKFKMERPNLVQIGDHVEITEIQTNMNFSYFNRSEEHTSELQSH